MKAIIALFMFSTLAYAQKETPCAVPGAPTVEPTVAAVAEALNPDRNNNKCPNQPYRDYFAGVTSIADLRIQTQAILGPKGLQTEWNAGSDSASNSSWSSFEDTPADLERAKRLANVTVAAMSQYPAGFFGRAGLTKIKMVKDLKVTYEGTAQSRMAMPKPSTDTLVYAENNEPGLTSCLEEIEMRMHHELFHLLEGTTHNNNMYTRESSYTALNPAGFEYKDGGGDAYKSDAGYADKEHPLPGFSTGYATFGQEEDRSEVFAYMMTRGFAQRQSEWAAADPVIARKVQWVENFLRTRVKEPGMTTAYFDNIETIPSLRSPSSPSVVRAAP